MAPNWDEPTGATLPQAILFSGNFTIRPLCHERQLHHLATLPTGVTSPCISVEPPCESCQNGRHNEPLPVLPGNELNQSSPKLKTMVVKTINCHHFICLFYQACAISAWHCLFWRLVLFYQVTVHYIGCHVTSCTGYILHTSFWLKCWKLRCHDFSALAD